MTYFHSIHSSFFSKRHRSGAVLVEFVLGMFVMLLFVFAALDLMRAYLTAQIVGEAVRIAAREAATLPSPSGQSIEEFNDAIFDSNYSAIDLDIMFIGDLNGDGMKNTLQDRTLADLDNDGVINLDELFRTLPPVHSALRSAMYREIWIERNNTFLPLAMADADHLEGTRRRILRLPGALFWNPTLPHGTDLRVVVPLIEAEGNRGYDTNEAVAPRLVPHFGALNPDSSGIIRTHIYYPFSFFTQLDIRGSGVSVPIRHNPDDLTRVGFGTVQRRTKREVIITPEDAIALGLDPSAGWQVVDYGLSRWQGAGHRNPFRNLIVTMRLDAAARRMLPGP